MNQIFERVAARRWAAVWLAIAGSTLCSCLVDASNRCGTHQVLQADLCACEAGYGLVGTQCQACAENEVGSLTGCDCAPGYGRADATQTCAAVASLGASCSQDADCSDATFSYCAREGDVGYCTRPDCSTSADCTNDYSCNQRTGKAFCQRPPSGFGTSCQSNDDCASFEASYCESLSSHVCLKSDCKADPSVCPGDWSCCDIALLGQSICLPPAELEGGACPAGGHLISEGS